MQTTYRPALSLLSGAAQITPIASFRSALLSPTKRTMESSLCSGVRPALAARVPSSFVCMSYKSLREKWCERVCKVP